MFIDLFLRVGNLRKYSFSAPVLQPVSSGEVPNPYRRIGYDRSGSAKRYFMARLRYSVQQAKGPDHVQYVYTKYASTISMDLTQKDDGERDVDG